MLNKVWNSSGLVVLVNSPPVRPSHRPNRFPTDALANVNHPQFDFGVRVLCRKTYVCFRFRATVASRHCVHPEINGPLFYVTPTGPGMREQGLVTEVMGWCRKGKLQRYSSTLHANGLLNQYLLSQECRTDENSVRGAQPPKAEQKECV